MTSFLANTILLDAITAYCNAQFNKSMADLMIDTDFSAETFLQYLQSDIYI